VNTGPATGAHQLATTAASRLDITVASGGVVVGTDGDEPVVVQLFRARPTQIVLLTAGYVARLLALRTLAARATVHVATSRPHSWQPFAVAAPPGRVHLVPAGSPLPATSSPGSPVLRCDDTGPAGAGDRTEIGAWQARAVVQDFTPAAAVTGLRAYDLVIAQRIPPDLVHPLRIVFGLPPDLAEVLCRIPDDVIALLTPNWNTLIRLEPTQAETSLLGHPVRHDGFLFRPAT
jgi:hypothetical protein